MSDLHHLRLVPAEAGAHRICGTGCEALVCTRLYCPCSTTELARACRAPSFQVRRSDFERATHMRSLLYAKRTVQTGPNLLSRGSLGL